MAITPLTLDPSAPPRIDFRPPILEPMLVAAEAGRDLVPPLQRIVRTLGFESFMYGVSPMARQPDRDTPLYFFATLPREWSLLYEREAYIEIDPRIALAVRHSAPVPWDRAIALDATPPGQRARVERFLDDAARFGIRSGLAWVMRTPSHDGVLIALNSVDRAFDAAQQRRCAANMGEILAFGTYFHEFFMRNFVDRGMPSRLRGAALSDREIEVLGLVARGLTAEDIAHKLDIAPRTVRHHVDSARTKIGALNREEAIAIVAKAGLISVLP
jgi:LuxR family transcriptional regulator